MGFTREQLALCEGASIPDLIGEECTLLFVGINPGLQTAMTGIHFAHPSNRFWPALRRAGLIDFVPDLSPSTPAVPIDGERPGGAGEVPPATHSYPVVLREDLGWGTATSTGMSSAQRKRFTDSGMGITNLVHRATVRASHLDRSELREGARRLERLVGELTPVVIAVAGVTAYRLAFGRPMAGLGPQPRPLVESELWVVPNPSGLNAHETVESLAAWWRRVGDAAGLR